MFIEANPGFDIGSHLGHGLLDVVDICLLGQLLGKVLFVCFGRQDLFDLLDAIALGLQNVAYSSECETDDIRYRGPFAGCLLCRC